MADRRPWHAQLASTLLPSPFVMFAIAPAPWNLAGLLRLSDSAQDNSRVEYVLSEIRGEVTPDFSALFSFLFLTSASQDGELDESPHSRLPHGQEETVLLFFPRDATCSWFTGQTGGLQLPVSTWQSAPPEEQPASVFAQGHSVSAAILLPMLSYPTAGVELAATPLGDVTASSPVQHAAQEEDLLRPLKHEPPLFSTLLVPVPSETTERISSTVTYTEGAASSQAGTDLVLSFLPDAGATKGETADLPVGQVQVDDPQKPSLRAQETTPEVRPPLMLIGENSLLVESVPLNPTVKERSTRLSLSSLPQFSSSPQHTGQKRLSYSPADPGTVQTHGLPLRLTNDNAKQESGAEQPPTSFSRGVMEPGSDGGLHVPLPQEEPFRPTPIFFLQQPEFPQAGNGGLEVGRQDAAAGSWAVPVSRVHVRQVTEQGEKQQEGKSSHSHTGTAHSFPPFLHTRSPEVDNKTAKQVANLSLAVDDRKDAAVLSALMPSHPSTQDFLAPSPRPPALAPRVPSESWQALMGRVAGEISAHVRHNIHEALLQLEPPELGKLRIDLVLEGDTVQARIVAEVAEVGTLLRTHLPELKEALQQHNLALGEVRVDINGWSEGRGELPQGFQRESGTREEKVQRTAVRGPRSTAPGVVHHDQGSGISVWA